jgi:hypothetical protein
MRRRIAGIIDCHGGLRVVVGTTRDIYANCNIMYPERLFLLPRQCWVRTDENDRIPWDMIPWTVRRVELYIKWWCDTRNDPDDLKHVAIERYLLRYVMKNSDGTGGEGSLHIAGLLPSPDRARAWPS